MLVAGFQGVSQDSKDVTTLGRGGSDTTAVALAAALQRRRVRDLHRRRRHLHRRPAHRAQRAPPRHRQLRGDARDGGGRRQGAHAALRGIRPPLRRSDTRPVVVLRQAGHARQRIDGGHPHGRRHPHRSRPRPRRGEGHRRRTARRSRLRRQGVSRRGRCRRQHRHGAAEHLQDRGRQDRHHVHLLAGERTRRGREAGLAAGRHRLQRSALRRSHRQGVAGRRRHAQPPRRHRHVL